VIVIAAAMAGARGISRWGLAGASALFAGYFLLRFLVLRVGSPALLERSSGFGFQSLDPAELVARFGANPLPFYAYNVVSSLSSVLFAEPRSGVFQLTRGLINGQPSVSGLITTAGATLGTMLIAAYVWQRRREWVAGRLDRDGCIIVIFAAVLAANAVISYPYTKDVVMSPAGAFYAAAVYVAVRRLLVERLFVHDTKAMWRAAVFGAVLATCWGIRAVGTHLNIRTQAYKVRDEWAYVDDDFALSGRTPSASEERLLRRLQSDAIDVHPAPPRLPMARLPIFEVN
jgi:hypothetical protein